jgi:hypothetical protein
MKLTDIDELFKTAMDESERRSEHQLLDAKSRVWEAIQKPKARNRQRWLLMSSIAAAVSMFVIASILYLKLDTKQKELEFLQAEVINTVQYDQENPVIEPRDHTPMRKEEVGAVPVSAPAVHQHKAITNTESKFVKEETIPRRAGPHPTLTSPRTELIAQLDPVIDLPQEIEQINVPQASTAATIDPEPRKRAKLRLKIGNRTAPYHDNNKSLALNIKF